MSMVELKKMMIRMVVTKAKNRDNLNCDFDDQYYDGVMTMRLMMMLSIMIIVILTLITPMMVTAQL